MFFLGKEMWLVTFKKFLKLTHKNTTVRFQIKMFNLTISTLLVELGLTDSIIIKISVGR